MCDRNGIPSHGNQNSYYIWFPLTLNNGTASIEYSDTVRINTTTGVIKNENNGSLVSEGKTATSSSNATSHEAGLANDGDYSTEWVASGVTYPSTWTVDLGANYSLNDVELSFYLCNGSEATEYYKIQASTDGTNFTTVLNNNNNTRYGFNNDKLYNVTSRYVRIEMDQSLPQNNENNSWYTPRLYEVKVYGTSE